MAEGRITPISVPYPPGEHLELQLSIGPARVRIGPGDAEPWVSGTYHDPSGRVPLHLETKNSTARIAQTHRLYGVLSETPRFDLRLGTGRPFALTFEAGAIDDTVCDLGGVPLTELEVKYGAGEIRLDFSAPNPQPMTRLHLTAGAAETEMLNLANANAEEILVEGGAASFALDFGGELLRDMRVRITTGMATVEIRVPGATAARITPLTTLGSLDPGSGFVTRDGGFWTMAAVAGDTPALTVEASVALGSLKLRTT